MRDFALIRRDDGWHTDGETTALATNVRLSLTIAKGSWWAAPVFGHRFAELKKLTAKTPALCEAYAREALKWLLDAKRATAIEAEALADPETKGRLLLRVRVFSATAPPVLFERYIEVI